MRSYPNQYGRLASVEDLTLLCKSTRNSLIHAFTLLITSDLLQTHTYTQPIPLPGMADVTRTYSKSSFAALCTFAFLLVLSNAHNNGNDITKNEDNDRGARGGCELVHYPLVQSAYKERDLVERQLWDMMMRETGIVQEHIGKQVGAGGLPVEIWLGKRKDLR